MRGKCIKIYAAHWGVILSLGKVYDISFKEYEYTMIDNKDEYIKKLKRLSGLGSEAQSELIKVKNSPEYIFSPVLKEVMKNANDEIKKNKFNVKLTAAIVTGDLGSSFQMCAFSRDYLLERYKTYYFDSTVYLLEDYFEMMDEIRDQKIIEILS